MKSFLLALTLLAQGLGSLDNPPPRTHQFVAYAAEQQTVPAGKRAVLELHFKVDSGYHVNSHTPKSELLIPTRVELKPAEGIEIATPEYPPGQEYTFAFDPTEKLDVYANGFVVKVPVTLKSAGSYSLQGTLKYQACDKAACYPPKSLPFTALVTSTMAPKTKPAS